MEHEDEVKEAVMCLSQRERLILTGREEATEAARLDRWLAVCAVVVSGVLSTCNIYQHIASGHDIKVHSSFAAPFTFILSATWFVGAYAFLSVKKPRTRFTCSMIFVIAATILWLAFPGQSSFVLFYANLIGMVALFLLWVVLELVSEGKPIRRAPRRTVSGRRRIPPRVQASPAFARSGGGAVPRPFHVGTSFTFLGRFHDESSRERRGSSRIESLLVHYLLALSCIASMVLEVRTGHFEVFAVIPFLFAFWYGGILFLRSRPPGERWPWAVGVAAVTVLFWVVYKTQGGC